MDMLLLRTIISSVAIIIAGNLGLCFCGCAPAEYEIDGECCPMCAPGNRVYWRCTVYASTTCIPCPASTYTDELNRRVSCFPCTVCDPGNHVYRHCTEDTSTTCIPCPASTYTDEPNGLISCFPCTVCDPAQHLKVQKACKRSADTICEAQEGFYCIKVNKDSCAFAVEHSACKPGQYIKQSGSAFRDTVCANCTYGTYSDGSLKTCVSHSKCETMGLREVKAGTASSDADCVEVSSVGLIAGVTISILIALIVLLLACIIYRKHKARGTNEGVLYIQHQLKIHNHSTVKEWSAQDCGISKAAKDTSMLPSKFDQKKVPPETGSEAEFGLGRVLMPSCHGMCSPKELWDTADVSPFKEIGAAPACLRVLSKTCLKETLGLTY